MARTRPILRSVAVTRIVVAGRAVAVRRL